MMRLRNKLYAITDEKLLGRALFLSRVSEVLSAGAGMIQLREKTTRPRDRLALGKELVRLARPKGVKIIVNDDPLLAREIGADGVHLGKSDASIERARALLGENAIIGVSCYGDLKRAERAQKLGASYVSFGAFFPSPTKPQEPLAPPDILTEAKSVLKIPIVAIGGITARNARSLLDAGADAISVVSAAFSTRNAGSAIQKLMSVLGE